MVHSSYEYKYGKALLAVIDDNKPGFIAFNPASPADSAMIRNIRTQRASRRAAVFGFDGLAVGNEVRASFIQACCGSNGQPRSALDHGLRIFTELVGRRMLDYEQATTDLLDTLWNHSRPQSTYLDRQMETATQIVKLVRETTAQTTIDDIVEQVFRDFGISANHSTSHKHAMRHLVFAVIGWSTMLYTPMFKSADAPFSTAMTEEHQFADGSEKQSFEQSSKRPLGAVLRAHRLMPIACPPGTGHPQGLPTLLTVTHLNFFSLSRLGDVTITWVDDLAQHGEFDRYTKRKELKLFRLPSLCANICLNEGTEALVGQLFRSHICQQNCRAGPETVARAYLIEVLLSYRLLFGQHARSRRLFREHEVERAKCNGALDPLLSALCGDKDMEDFCGTKELLRERGVYNAQTNFPHLGPRLIELQDYSTCQRPRNISEVWNDQRDPERLLTFKAVIIVGGASIVLSFLQLVVGLTQIAVAVR